MGRKFYDIIFYDESLGISFNRGKNDVGAYVDGFYQVDHQILEAERSRKESLYDKVIAIQGKNVEYDNFKDILHLFRSKSRPVKVTFAKYFVSNSVEISWNAVMNDSYYLNFYSNFIKEKNLFLCGKWISFIIDLFSTTFLKGVELETKVDKLWLDYVDINGKNTPYMFFKSSQPLPISNTTEKLYYLNIMKTKIYNRINRLSWYAFVNSAEYFSHFSY